MEARLQSHRALAFVASRTATDGALSAAALRVLICLGLWVDETDGTARASVEQLAAATRLDARSITTAIADLERRRYIARERRNDLRESIFEPRRYTILR